MYKNSKILIIFLSLLILFSNTISVKAFTPEENISSNKIKYDQITSELSDIDSDVAKLDVEIEQLTSTLNENKEKISSKEGEIEFTKGILEKTQLEIEDAQKMLSTRIRSMYKSNLNSNMLIFVLTSESFSDFFSRIDAASRIISFDKKLINQVKEKELSLNENMDKLSKDKNELIALKANIELSLKTVEDKKADQKILMDKLNSEKDKIFGLIEANEQKLIEHPISIINASSSSLTEIQSAINTLEALIPQLNSSYVIGLAKDAIYAGNTIIAEANKPVPPPLPPSSNNGDGIATYTMESTAYTGGGLTAMGLKPVRDPEGISTIAVDPSVIPLGSKVYVSGYGTAIASDTGGAIKGNIIDVYLNSYADCISWGRRSVTVTLLAYPGEW